MEFQKNIKKEIYSCSVDFTDIIELIKFIINENPNEHEKLSLNLNLDDGSTINLSRLKDTEELESIQNKKITYLRLNYDNVFNLTLSKNSFLSYDSKSQFGHFIYSYTIKQLNLNVNSIIIRTFSYSFIFIFSIAMMSLLYNAFIFNNIFLLIINSTLVLSVFIIFLFYTNRVEIIMGSNKDFFTTRNKDNIIISLSSLVIGFILGKYF